MSFQSRKLSYLAVLSVLSALLGCGRVDGRKKGGDVVSICLFGLMCTKEDPTEPGGGNDDSQKKHLFSGEIRQFATNEEFDGYMSGLAAERESAAKVQNSTASNETTAAQPMADAAEGSTNETITNNQESGVDEGDIVKNIDDSMIVLRKGRLYAVNAATSGSPVQTDAIRVAQDEHLNGGVWYDEMLVHGSRLYVIGYRYGIVLEGDAAEADGYQFLRGATEINSFVLKDGKFERLKSIFVESSDYYSGSNYASRLVGGKIVFYMPFYGFRYWQNRYVPHIPARLAYRGNGKFASVGRLFSGTDVFVPITPPTWPTFHTVVSCSLPDSGDLECQARALLGEAARQHYVSNDAVFLWTLPYVYAFGLSDLKAAAHKAIGYPSNQFAFRQDGDLLNVITVETAYSRAISTPMEDAVNMKAPAAANARVLLLRLKLSDFNAFGDQTIEGERVRELMAPSPYAYVTTQRFVGGSLLAAIATGTIDGPSLIVHDIASSKTSPISLSGYVQRIEPVGPNRALVVSADYRSSTQSLKLSIIGLGDEVAVKSTHTMDGVGQGESRSHGFFYKSRGETAGTFGLPVINTGDRYGWWGNGIANIAFFDVSSDAAMADLGMISSGGEVGVCETSCIDWYGNTRPVFFKDRVFALMGSEFIEVTLRPAVGPLGAEVVLH